MLRGLKVENPEQELKGPEDMKKNKFTAVRATVTVFAFLAPVALAVVLFMMMIGLAPGGCGCVVVGKFGEVELSDPTSVNVDFVLMNYKPKPMEFQVWIAMDGSADSLYSFGDNDGGELILSSGANVGTLTYVDTNNNRRVDKGDQLSITNLEPDSDYTIRLIWLPTGDLVTSTSFSTPPG
jgi:hypothetical protein